jgi:hypothetical protein
LLLQSINEHIAEKMIADRSRDYMNARRVAKEYEAVTRGINKNALSVSPQGTAEEAKQLELWRKYIAWEKSNPLRSEDMAVVIKRGIELLFVILIMNCEISVSNCVQLLSCNFIFNASDFHFERDNSLQLVFVLWLLMLHKHTHQLPPIKHIN